jgi:lipopolysaccharide biosynthesis glycosyltransferase
MGQDMKAKKAFSVVYATDANFWPHVFVSLFSLLSHHRDHHWRVFLLCDQPDKTFVRNVAALRQVGNLPQIQYIAMDHKFEHAPRRAGLSPATYYRLRMGHLLPPDVDRVLYLDGDTVVVSPIDDLLDVDLDGRIFAAVQAVVWEKHVRRLGLPGTAYLNSGVLLVDLQMWRSTNAEQRLLAYIAANEENLEQADQDALNAAFLGEWLPVSDRFNFSPKFRGESDPSTAIIHYSGNTKPWDQLTDQTLRTAYWRYRNQTPYGIAPKGVIGRSLEWTRLWLKGQ